MALGREFRCAPFPPVMATLIAEKYKTNDMSTLSTIITAKLSLIGVPLGAGLQYYFSKSSEERKKLTSLRTQAYVDYLQSVAKFTQAAEIDTNERLKLLAEAAYAKTRICIYGSKNVVKLLAEFESNGAKIASGESKETFIALCSQMRAEGINSEENLPVDDLKLVLFGLEKYICSLTTHLSGLARSVRDLVHAKLLVLASPSVRSASKTVRLL